MKAKRTVYLDTTVPSAYLDGRAVERQQLTQVFWNERLPVFDCMISTLVLEEIRGTPNLQRRAELEEIVAILDVLSFTEEARSLAQEYVRWGVFSEKTLVDARHVAVAVVNRIDYIVSWNFRHLVQVVTRHEVNLINALQGYGSIEIVAPPEI